MDIAGKIQVFQAKLTENAWLTSFYSVETGVDFIKNLEKSKLRGRKER